MPSGNELGRIYDPDDPAITATFEQWRTEIMAARKWDVGGAVELDVGETGQTLFMASRQSSARHAVVLSPGISAASGPDTLGSGPIMLRTRDGAALEDDRSAVCYINFTVGIPTGTRITVVPDGRDWTIPGANCPIP